MHKPFEMVDHPNAILRRAVANERVALAAGLDEAGLFPFFSTAASPSAPRTVFAGCEVVNLGSNNYLGLANDERVIDAAVEATLRFGSGLTGSRLMNGNSEIHDELEEMLCRFTGAEAALVFSTGYGANLGAITGLTTPADTVVTDTEVHASLYDGIAMAGVTLRRFRHNNTRHAHKILTSITEKDGAGGTMLVVDGIYSMRGDAAPLVELANLCDESGTVLFVDEAHGLGVVGPTGVGAIEAAGVIERTHLVSYTFSKSLASCGGAVLGPKSLIDALKITTRPFLFTASNTPGSLAAAATSLGLLIEHPTWPAEVMGRARYLRDRLAAAGIPVNVSDSAVLTVPIGSDIAAITAWRALFDAGVFVNPVLAPGVAEGHELLRLSVMRTHTDADLDFAAEAFTALEPFLPAHQSVLAAS